MDVILRYVVATVVAVVAGWIGYHFVPIEPFGVIGNTLFFGALFGLIMGFARITGFLGNIINASLLSFPLWYILPGEWFVIWVCGNVGYSLGNMFGQLAMLSVNEEIEVTAL
jgi:mannose/fructose/N-acetylgalactosamine-specific phosphotransferase system component IID